MLLTYILVGCPWHNNNWNKLDFECTPRTRWALFCISPQSTPRKLSILTAISNPCPPFTAVCEETSMVTPRFFSHAFAKNSLIKNIFEEEKKFDRFFGGKWFRIWCIWWRRGLQANHGTVQKSAISPQPGNQKPIKWSNTAYFNKRSFMFKLKFCVFQVTKT